MHIETTDLTITIGSIIGFLFFFAMHVFVFRKIRARDAVRWFFILVVVAGILLFVIQTSLASMMLFIIIACCYFMGVFGLMATSVRIRILCEIARTGTTGITMKELVMRYNNVKIVTHRLARLVSNGDLKYFQGKYHARKGFTFFSFPALLLECMKLLYGSGPRG